MKSLCSERSKPLTADEHRCTRMGGLWGLVGGVRGYWIFLLEGEDKRQRPIHADWGWGASGEVRRDSPETARDLTAGRQPGVVAESLNPRVPRGTIRGRLWSRPHRQIVNSGLTLFFRSSLRVARDAVGAPSDASQSGICGQFTCQGRLLDSNATERRSGQREPPFKRARRYLRVN